MKPRTFLLFGGLACVVALAFFGLQSAPSSPRGSVGVSPGSAPSSAAPRVATAAPSDPVGQTLEARAASVGSTGSVPGAARVDESFFAADVQEVPGIAVEVAATVSGEEKPRVLRANTVGLFERVRVQPGAAVAFTVRYPAEAAGRKVAVAVQDGGSLDDGVGSLVLEPAADGVVRFRFTAGQSRGIYHVGLRRGGDLKTLDVWAGADIALAQ